MEIEFRKSFIKDIKKLNNKQLKQKLKLIITDIEKAQDIREISNLKFLKGEDNHYRIRIGNYRIGIIIKNGVVRFVRFLHRKEIYKFFP